MLRRLVILGFLCLNLGALCSLSLGDTLPFPKCYPCPDDGR
jgi:hypothetical protein